MSVALRPEVHKTNDLQAVGDNIVAASNPFGFGCDVFGEAIILGLPASAIAPDLFGLRLVKLEGELGLVESRFSFCDALPLVDKKLAQAFCLLLSDKRELLDDLGATGIGAAFEFRLQIGGVARGAGTQALDDARWRRFACAQSLFKLVESSFLSAFSEGRSRAEERRSGSVQGAVTISSLLVKSGGAGSIKREACQ